MKRKLSFILVLIIILTTIPSNAFAEKSYDTQLKEAIIKSKKLFNIGSEYDKFKQSISSRGESTVFNLNWSDSKDRLGEINVSITMEGNILSYGKWKYNYGEQETKLPNISKEEGLEIATKFIKKVSPSFSDKIKYKDISEPLRINSDSYVYNFTRVENEIPYYNNSINVYVDNSTGEVKDYYTNWDMDLKFIDIKDIISLDKAKELYKEKIGLDLIYKLNYRDKDQKPFLVYGPLNKGLGINGKDGEVVSSYDYFYLYDKAEGMGGMIENAVEKELGPEEEKAIDNISGIISKEEAEILAREILELDKEYNLNHISLYTSWRNDDEYNWDMGFIKDMDNKSFYANININAKTKKILNFFKDTSVYGDEKVKLNKEQLLNIAKDFIRKYNSENYNNFELRENLNYPEEEKRNSFKFIRKIDNIYVEEDGVNISVSAVNGKVEQYSLNWSNKDFPLKDNLISLDKAYDILFNEIEMELKYVLEARYDIYDKKSIDQKEAILVYGLKNEKPANIDANTGAILNDIGKVYDKLRIIKYKDIQDSYAKDKINILAQYGIALVGEEFKPKENISQKDFLYLLLKAKEPYYRIENSEDDLYKQLINMGVIKEEERSPEKTITKEEAVKYMIRTLKYDKVADLAHIYKDIFKDTEDISPELRGYISIAYGLGIIEGYNEKLYPKSEVKREDGANMIYNLLFNGN